MSIQKINLLDYNTWVVGVHDQAEKRKEIQSIGEAEHVVRVPAGIKDISKRFKGLVNQVVFEDRDGVPYTVQTRVFNGLGELDSYDFSNHYLHSMFHHLSIGYDADYDELLEKTVEAADQGTSIDLTNLDMTTNERYTIRIALHPDENMEDLRVKQDDVSA